MEHFDILHLAESYLPDRFGMARRMSSLQQGVRYSTRFIVSDRLHSGEIVPVKDENHPGLRITRVNTHIPKLAKYAQLGLVYQLTSNRLKLVRQAVSNQCSYKIIHAHQGPEFATAGQTLARRLGVPFIYEEHIPLTDFSRKLGRPLMERIRASLFKSAQMIITQSDLAKQCMIDQHHIDPDKVHVITNGVDTTYFNVQQHRAEGARIKDSIQAGGYKIATYMGYLDSGYNGVDRMLELAQDEDIRAQKVMFVFVGDGPMTQRIEQLAKSHPTIVRMPPVKPTQVGPIYAMTDIFLLPRPAGEATSTLFPLKLLEALAMGNIVVGSDLKSIVDVIEHRKNGFIFGPSTGLSFKECFLEALQADSSTLQAQAEASVLSRFNWTRSSEKLNAVYDCLIHERFLR